jgi:hypothetical protein
MIGNSRAASALERKMFWNPLGFGAPSVKGPFFKVNRLDGMIARVSWKK